MLIPLFSFAACISKDRRPEEEIEWGGETHIPV